MKYYNIKNHSQKISFREAVSQGISSDMGLFMPEAIPMMDESFFKRLSEMNLPQIAFEVGSKYIGDEISSISFKTMCDEAFNFPIQLKQINGKKYVLELFHGPTAAFKDFGARFMSQCFRHFSTSDNQKMVVLVATSGDTGGAIANSFLGIEGVDVVILYPSGKVSELQEKQLTALGNNITALEVDGTFDDCQAMVKAAFTQFEAKGKIKLTSANSINIARLIPQSFYYYYAVSRLKSNKPVISVPSGNFGNITGALLAWKSGLPIERFIAATNINNVVPEYLESRVYNPRKSIQTIANAMDVGNPSNFDRLFELFNGDWAIITSMISGYWFNDDQIRKHIEDEFKRSGYILDPHGAVASLGFERYLNKNPNSIGIIVETAHPAKFFDVVQPIIGQEIPMPESLNNCLKGMKSSIRIRPEYGCLEEYLRDKYSE
ncbi:MAG: threonine synthase [Bacteroidales bacterium]|nr:MAG: threonine synthase [Bacteroidales bacterium]